MSISYTSTGSGLKTLFPDPIIQKRDPVPSDVGSLPGQPWINELTNNIWMLTSFSGGLANWEPISQSASGSSPITPFVVAQDGTGDYTTIQAAINAAGAGPASIWIRPGNYTENLAFAVISNISLVGAVANSDVANHVTITGIHNASTSGSMIFRNIRFVSATHVISTLAAGNSTLEVDNCQFVLTNGAIFNLSTWVGTLTIRNCRDASTLNSIVDNNAGSATINILYSIVGVGTTTMKTKGTTNIIRSEIGTAIDFQMGTIARLQYTTLRGNVLTSDNAVTTISDCYFNVGAVAAITHSSTNPTQITNSVISSSNNPSIDGAGAGVIIIGSIDFVSNSVIAATLTVTQLTTGTGVIAGRGNIATTRAVAAGNLLLSTFNSDNTSGTSNAFVQAVVGGTSGGDPVIQTSISGGDTYSFGIDNSTTNDDFVISKSTTIGTGNIASWDGSSGELTIPAAMTITNGNLVLGNAAAGVEFNAGPRLLAGAGDPNTAVSAAQGSLYMRSDGSSTTTRAYINTDGATAWTSVTTAT
jgi:hypothetical protein